MQLRGQVKGKPREGGEIEVGWPDEGKGHKDDVGLVSKSEAINEAICHQSPIIINASETPRVTCAYASMIFKGHP